MDDLRKLSCLLRKAREEGDNLHIYTKVFIKSVSIGLKLMFFHNNLQKGKHQIPAVHKRGRTFIVKESFTARDSARLVTHHFIVVLNPLLETATLLF